jgi:hypothetical protein
VTSFRKAVELNPRNEPAFFSLIHLLGRICDWREYEVLEEILKILLCGDFL